MNISLKDVSYIYNQGTANESIAVNDVTLDLSGDQFIALIGSTGSGKSTLIQLLNSLKQPTTGKILYNGQELGKDKKKQQQIRCSIGLVFQYPEYQLFAESVLRDVMFGPANKGLDEEQARARAEKALMQVGISQDMFSKSPFDLSGGEKRRVAIAGIIAMEPEILILDEPTAGLDPAGKKQILDMVAGYRETGNKCVIMVSHNMDEVARYAQRIIVMRDGHVIMDGTPYEVFAHKEELEDAGLSLPAAALFAESLGITGVVTIEEAAKQIYLKYKK